MTDIEGFQDIELNEEARESILNEHPIVMRNYTVLTPMIASTYSLIRNRIWARRTGSFLYARPRMGKTWCANAINRLLAEEFPNVYQIMLSADQKHSSSNTGIVLDILESERLGVKSRMNYKEALSKLITHIDTCLASKGGDQFVLIVDEMQMLVEADLNVLLVLHNRLQQQQISMTTLGFAQPQILNLQSTLATTGAFNLIARFLAEPIPFDGCGTRNDLDVILQAYDEEKRHPENTDWTYTRFFLPQAYMAGFRLKSYSAIIWSNLEKAADGLGTNTIPMEHLTSTVEYLLLANRRLDSISFELSSVQVEDAVAASNLEHFAGLMGGG
ncbi:MAG: ATP-binding protein [Sulfurimonas sp.]|nr:ATP-binding protein [Sulfurimonas sp.]